MKTQNSNDGRRLGFGVYTDLVHLNIHCVPLKNIPNIFSCNLE